MFAEVSVAAAPEVIAGVELHWKMVGADGFLDCVGGVKEGVAPRGKVTVSKDLRAAFKLDLGRAPLLSLFGFVRTEMVRGHHDPVDWLVEHMKASEGVADDLRVALDTGELERKRLGSGFVFKKPTAAVQSDDAVDLSSKEKVRIDLDFEDLFDFLDFHVGGVLGVVVEVLGEGEEAVLQGAVVWVEKVKF